MFKPSMAELRAGQDIVYRFMKPTLAHAWPLLAERLHTKVVVKHENHTPAGAFKVRGGLTYFDA
jgi:threonine dehydratase